MRVVLTTAAWHIMALCFTIAVAVKKWDHGNEDDQRVRMFCYGFLFLFWLVALLVPFTYSRWQKHKQRSENVP